MPVADPPTGFEIESLTASDGRLEVRGRWHGVRGRRFVRPSLSAGTGGRPALADLAHKPWAPDGEDWIAVFPWSTPLPAEGELELAVAPDLAVALPVGDAGVLVPAIRPEPPARAEPPEPPEPPEPRAEPPARPVTPDPFEEPELQARVAEERQAARAELQRAAARRDAALAERDEARRQAEELAAQRDAAEHEREAARLRAEKAIAALSAAEERRDALVAQLARDRAAEHEHVTERDTLKDAIGRVTAERDALQRELAELRTRVSRGQAELSRANESLAAEQAQRAQLRAVAQLASRSPRRRTVRGLAGSVDWGSRVLALAALLVLIVAILAIVGAR